MLKIALGGMALTQTVEGRERYTVRVRYPRELRENPTDLRTYLYPCRKWKPGTFKKLPLFVMKKGHR